MKVIDLLNKIANGEEVPKKIGYDNKIFEFDELERQYTFHNLDYSVNDDLSLSIEGLRYSTLNDEVEIIEEDKKIEKLERFIPQRESDTYCTKYNEVADKINEIIDEVNKLKDDRK